VRKASRRLYRCCVAATSLRRLEPNITNSLSFAASKDMFSRRINGLAVEDPIVHTSVETAAPDMTRGKPTATPRYPRTSGGRIGPGTMDDAASASGARTEQPPDRLVSVKKRRLTARFRPESEVEGEMTG